MKIQYNNEDDSNSKNKNIINQYENNNFSDPNNVKYQYDLTEDSYCQYSFLDNIFCVFKSIDKILYLIYINENKSIIFYNLINKQKISEIKKAHKLSIFNFRHYLDKINKRDLILSISFGNNIKVWDIKNLKCLLNMENIYDCGTIYSACFINDNNQNYIITSNSDYPSNFGLIKIFDFNGNKVKEINNSNDSTFFIDTYYDKRFLKYYIITGNYDYVKSYDYNNNKMYRKYCDSEDKEKDKSCHISIVINDFENEIKMIESSYDGNIRIWNFHSGDLLKKIYVSKYQLNGICLWNNNYLFVGCHDKNIKLIELNKEKIIDIVGHKKYVLTIKKIIHPNFGECLISQGPLDDQIKLWINQS